ncbi:recombinase family protein [Lentzea indica]|uniref:recombinase family protein n=1 Tax=Lentzea indica TaxID=2604800 RepID=UPI0028AC123D|nr:recombinase family protein [Lentzea indica]
MKRASLGDLNTVRVGIYVRRSTDDEHQPFTKEAQKGRLKLFVGSQPGWGIVKIFEDDASGATTNRKGLQEAMKWAKAGRLDVLLVYRVDRFSRCLKDVVTLLDELDKVGVAFRSATEAFDTSDPMGRMLVQMLATSAEFERQVIIDRVTAGMERKAERGQWGKGPTPHGYGKDPKTHVLQSDDAECGVISLIFDLYTRDLIGSRSIATVLNDRGYRTRSGQPWNYKQILAILQNRVYLGEIQFQDVIKEHAHKPLVGPKQFEEAQRLLELRGESSARASTDSDYIVSGRMKCPKCHKAMIGTRANGRNNTYRYYTCWTRNRFGTDACDMDRLNADAVDEVLAEAVASFYRSQHQLIRDAVELAIKQFESSHDALKSELKVLEADLSNVTQKIDRYLDAFEDGKVELDDENFKKRMEAHSTAQKRLRARREELLLELTTEPAMPDRAVLDEITEQIAEVFDAGNNNQRKALMEALVVEVKVLSPDRLVPVFRVPQPSEDPEGAGTGLPVPAPRVRAESEPVGRQGLEP